MKIPVKNLGCDHCKPAEDVCKHCDYPIVARNISGFCDHLYYPENCETCVIADGIKPFNVPPFDPDIMLHDEDGKPWMTFRELCKLIDDESVPDSMRGDVYGGLTEAMYFIPDGKNHVENCDKVKCDCPDKTRIVKESEMPKFQLPNWMPDVKVMQKKLDVAIQFRSTPVETEQVEDWREDLLESFDWEFTFGKDSMSLKKMEQFIDKHIQSAETRVRKEGERTGIQFAIQLAESDKEKTNHYTSLRTTLYLGGYKKALEDIIKKLNERL